mmetsp:Transcript_52785/g.153533  ORF Transcript_52785/g.153533 Transcript_52785/m.153533 type:complete len:238 (+) Transcript_52785:402-1115(+)
MEPALGVAKHLLRCFEVTFVPALCGLLQRPRDLHPLALCADLLVGLRLRLRLLHPNCLHAHGRRSHRALGLEVRVAQRRLKEARHSLRVRSGHFQLHKDVAALLREDVGKRHRGYAVTLPCHSERCIDALQRHLALKPHLHVLRYDAAEAAHSSGKGLTEVLGVLHKGEGRPGLLGNLGEQRGVVVLTEAEGIQAAACLPSSGEEAGKRTPCATVITVREQQDRRDLVSLPALLHHG